MDITLTVSPAPDILLKEAMRQKLKFKKKWMKATHHTEFLSKCTETGRVPNRPDLVYSKIHTMKVPYTGRTRAAIAQPYKRAERDICKALQEHYADIKTQTESQLEEGDRHIKHHLEKDPPES